MRLEEKESLKHIIAILFILLFGLPVYSQENENIDILIKKAGELIYSNPNESIKIGNHLLKRDCTDEEISEINLLIAESYNTKGDYNNVLKHVFEAGSKAYAANDSIKVSILLLKAKVTGNLYLDNQFNNYLDQADEILKSTVDKNFKEATAAGILLERSRVNIIRQDYEKSLKLFDSLKKNSNALKENSFLRLRHAIYKGVALAGNDEIEESGAELNYAKKEYQQINSSNALYKVYISFGLGNYYSRKGEYQKAIDTLLVALSEAERIGNIMLLKEVNNQLAINYLMINDKEQHRKYNEAFMILIMQVEDMEVEAVNTIYNLMGKEEEAYIEHVSNGYDTKTYILGGILVLLIFTGGALFYTNKLKIQRLKEIMSYLEISSTTNAVLKPAADKKGTPKKLAIPTETEQNILGKLKKFESTIKYTNKDMSLATLAAQLDVNTKYLSEIINKHYQDNFNAYINKLRINYIIEKLRNNPEYLNYKISYLAEESGFSSHSSFATVFKSITGIAPTTFIELLGEETKNKEKVLQ